MRNRPLSKTHPWLAKEWSERNFPFTPDDETAASRSRVWWRGECGHEWQAGIKGRAQRRSGCPYCNGPWAVLPGRNDLKSKRPDLMEHWSDKNGDLDPATVGMKSRFKVWWKCSCGHEWQASVYTYSRFFYCPKCALDNVVPGENDLLTLAPDIAEGWDYMKNQPLTPDKVGITRKKKWWRCRECGGSYMESIIFEINRGKKRCPLCSGRATAGVKGGKEDFRCIGEDLGSEDTASRSLPVPRSMQREGEGPLYLDPSEIGERFREVRGSIKEIRVPKHTDNAYSAGERPVWKKPALTVMEAVSLYPISLKKMRGIIRRDRNAGYLSYRGGYIRIMRAEFERYLDGVHDIAEEIYADTINSR